MVYSTRYSRDSLAMERMKRDNNTSLVKETRKLRPYLYVYKRRYKIVLLPLLLLVLCFCFPFQGDDLLDQWVNL